MAAAIVETIVFRQAVPPAASDAERITLVLTDSETAVLDDSPDRLAVVVYNYGPDPIELIFDGEPGGEPRRYGPFTGELIPAIGIGRASVRPVESED